MSSDCVEICLNLECYKLLVSSTRWALFTTSNVHIRHVLGFIIVHDLIVQTPQFLYLLLVLLLFGFRMVIIFFIVVKN